MQCRGDRFESDTLHDKKEYIRSRCQWYDDGASAPKAQCRYSLRGYIQADEFGNITPDLFGVPVENLPVVRYILPFPASVIQRSAGAYQNYYGYN